RYFFSWPYTQLVPNNHLIQWNIFLEPVFTNTPGCLRREPEQSSDRGTSLPARAKLEHLAQQHQRRDDRRGLEVDGNVAVMIAERCWKDSRCENGDHAEEIADCDTQTDQCEHVETAIYDRLPRAYEEWQPAQSTTGVARTSCTQASVDIGINCCNGCPGMRSLMPSTNTGIVRTTATQNRRDMSRSSGFSSSSRVTTSGSRAIPQIGQLPGWSRMISGCIGQVSFFPGVVTVGSGARAILMGVTAAGLVRKLSGFSWKRCRQCLLQK